MNKRKMVIVVDADIRETVEGIKFAISESFGRDALNVVNVFDTSFSEEDDFSITAFAIEADVENTLENNDIEATRERIVKLSNYVAMSDDLAEEVGFAVDRGLASLERDGEL